MGDLSSAVEAILDQAVAVIDFNLQDLGEVKSVVRGDRARPMPALPSVWVVPQTAVMQLNRFDDEAWHMPLSVSGLVKGDNPAEAGKLSQSLTALARSALLTGLKEAANAAGAEVIDVISVSFNPTARTTERNRTLFWTEAVVTVIFSVAE